MVVEFSTRMFAIGVVRQGYVKGVSVDVSRFGYDLNQVWVE